MGDPVRTFEELRNRAQTVVGGLGPLRLVLVAPNDADDLEAVDAARRLGLVDPVLVGDREQAEAAAGGLGLDLSTTELVEETDMRSAVRIAVELVCADTRAILMRGRIPVSQMMQVVLEDGSRLRVHGRLLTHVGIFQIEGVPRLILVSDGGMVAAPDLGQKIGIIENAIAVARALGNERPRVALLAAVETVYPTMPVTMEEAVISKMSERGQIKGAWIDGPLSLDVAVSEHAAQQKGVGGDVAGRADILIVSQIEVGNGMYKALVSFAGARAVGLVVGGRYPIVVTSRSDTVGNKIDAIAVACLLAGG